MLSIAQATWTRARPYQAAWRDAAIAWVAQHAVIVALVVMWQLLVQDMTHAPATFANVLYPFSAYDGEYYLHIARSGYTVLPDAAFFPLYPLLVHLLGGGLFAALLLANLFGFAAFGLLRILIEREADVPTARRALVYLTCFPTTMFLVAAYTESLFLTLALLTFLAVRREHWEMAALAATLATLTRSAGILLLVPIALAGWPALRQRVALVMAPPLAALAGWTFAISQHFHTASAIAAAMANPYWQRHLDWPWFGIARCLQAFGHAAFMEESEALRNLFFVLVWVALSVPMWRQLPRVYTLFAWACLALVLTMPQHIALGKELASAPRYMLVCFPLFWLLARWGRTKWAHLAILFGLLLPLAVLSLGFALGGFVS